MKVLTNIFPTIMGALGVTSSTGTLYGDSRIAVTGGVGTLYYKTGLTVQSIAYMQEINLSWTAITAPDDITCATGQVITVVDTDANGCVFAIGSAIVISNGVKASLAELAKILDSAIETLPFGTLDTKAGVESAMLGIINGGLISAGFTAAVSSTPPSQYVSPTWTGEFMVTSDTVPADTCDDSATRELTIVISAE